MSRRTSTYLSASKMEQGTGSSGMSWISMRYLLTCFAISSKKKVYHNYSWHRAHLEESLKDKLDSSEFAGFLADTLHMMNLARVQFKPEDL